MSGKIKIINIFLIVALFSLLLVSSSMLEGPADEVSLDLNNSVQQELQKSGDSPDTEAPSEPQGLYMHKLSETSITFKWNKSTDDTGVLGYGIYSSEIKPVGMNLVVNGGFEEGLPGWKLETTGVATNLTKIGLEKKDRYSGDRSARISITQSNKATDTVALISNLTIHPGCKYIVSFKAKSSIPRKASVRIKPTGIVSEIYNDDVVQMTEEWLPFRKLFSSEGSKTADWVFMIVMDGSGGTVWIDDVEIYEAMDTPFTKTGFSKEESYELKGLYSDCFYSAYVEAEDAAGNVSAKSRVISDISLALTDVPVPAKIMIDGQTSEWETLEASAYGQGKLKSISAAMDQSKLYILVTGDAIGTKNSLFIDSDNDYSTGYPDVEVKGADILLDESDNLYIYTMLKGKASWRYVGNAVSYRSKTVVEIAIHLIDMNIREPKALKFMFRDWISHESIPSLKAAMTGKIKLVTGIEDDQPPSVPVNIISSSKTLKTVTLKWTKSTDNIGVKGYAVYRDGMATGTTLYNEYTDSGLLEGNTYRYYIRAFDSEGNMSGESLSVPVTTNTFKKGTGVITRERWNDLDGSLDGLRKDPDFPDNPDETDQSVFFASPARLSNSYGARMRGYICPDKSGNYVFFISSDDSSELWLSTSESPLDKTLIAYVDGYTEYEEWYKYLPQKSRTVCLEAGRRYYVEALHVEGCRNDHMEVGWQMPGSSTIDIISGKNLSPFE